MDNNSDPWKPVIALTSHSPPISSKAYRKKRLYNIICSQPRASTLTPWTQNISLPISDSSNTQCNAHKYKSWSCYITFALFLFFKRIVRNRKRLAIIQRNNNMCTRTFGQKLIMLSVIGSREEPHGRILTQFLSPAVLLRKPEPQWGGDETTDLIGLFYLNSHRVWLRLLFAHHAMFAHCWHAASYILGFFRNRAAMQKELFYSIFCKLKNTKNRTSNIWKIPLKCDSGHINGW